jgi:anti-sigma regulatory factor (Ser/Thr protein kinase)
MSGTTTLELPRRAGSASIARLIVTAHGAALPEDRLKSANLMVSELVSNACRHGSGRIELCVHSGADGLEASVHDEGNGTIQSPDPRPARGGWGLHFVDQLSDTWGVEDHASRVWFKVSGPAAA